MGLAPDTPPPLPLTGGNGIHSFFRLAKMAREMPPPLPPSQLAAQKYNEVQNYDELIAAGVGEPFPILALLVHGEQEPAEEEQISEIGFG